VLDVLVGGLGLAIFGAAAAIAAVLEILDERRPARVGDTAVPVTPKALFRRRALHLLLAVLVVLAVAGTAARLVALGT
jgi:hypothetical protein